MKNREGVTAYPLSWPEGWPVTPNHLRQRGSQFKQAGGQYGKTEVTLDRARRLLFEELDRMRATEVTLSSNVPLRVDGNPRGDAGRLVLSEPGVAIYFTHKGKQMTMAQDAFMTPAANVRSLGLAIDALRALERHGGGHMMERAFAGFTSLPAPDGVRPKRAWWLVLNYSADKNERADLSVEEVEARFRTLAKRRHPDADGGSDEAFAELSEARADAVRDLGG